MQDSIKQFDKRTYLSLLIEEQKYRGVRVARQIITISIKCLNKNFGIGKIIFGVVNIYFLTFKLCLKLSFWPEVNKYKIVTYESKYKRIE